MVGLEVSGNNSLSGLNDYEALAGNEDIILKRSLFGGEYLTESHVPDSANFNSQAAGLSHSTRLNN